MAGRTPAARRLLCFDVDHALVTYLQPSFGELVHSCVMRFLVEKRKYPRSLLQKKYEGFAQKGLVFDTSTGCILKFDHHGSVALAYMGSETIDPVRRRSSVLR